MTPLARRALLVGTTLAVAGCAAGASGGGAAPAPAPAPAAPAGPTLVTDPNLPSQDPDAVWLAQAVTERPRMLRPVPLVYPDSLRRRGIGGDAVVEFVVDTLGRVERDIRVIEASHPGLAEPARATIRPARFRPGHVGGRKVRVMMTLRFHFAATGS
jgi:TonB family protein